jgi:ubiquinone/menaquinone biosynthesis C-methylase UbiE
MTELAVAIPHVSSATTRRSAKRSAPIYALGHSARELERLSIQGRVLEPLTRQLFRDAGIGPGMRVLDVGSGAGDVAFLASDLVGDTGEVIGMDRSEVALDVARARAKTHSLHNVSFQEGDPVEATFAQPFDAVVGRLVLMYYADPVTALRRLVKHLRPSGVIAFHEADINAVKSFPSAPTYDRCWQWIAETFRLLGTETRMGMKLYSAFVAAGLPPPSMRLEAFVGSGVDASDWLHVVAELTGTLLPEITRLGVASNDEICIGTLADRLCAENLASDGVVLSPSLIGAWSRL